jgi:hypothetical protein
MEPTTILYGQNAELYLRYGKYDKHWSLNSSSEMCVVSMTKTGNCCQSTYNKCRVSDVRAKKSQIKSMEKILLITIFLT